VNFPYKIA